MCLSYRFRKLVRVLIKLLIADDEPLVIAGLKTIINWSEQGVEICGTARNGKAAMELIDKLRPEIVITDIKMPVADGLSLLHNCREKYGRLPVFIILTNLEEYAHIKKAMQNQAVDYLVKLEMTPEMLLASIEKAKDVLQSLGVSLSGAKDEHGVQTLYDRFIASLITGQLTEPASFEKQKNELGIDFSFDWYVVCCAMLYGENINQKDREHIMSLYASTMQMARETIGKHFTCHIIGMDLQHFVLSLCFSGLEHENIENDIRHGLLSTKNAIKRYFNVDLDFTVGTIVNTPLLFCDSYKAAKKSMSLPERNSPVHFYQSDRKKLRLIEQVKEYIGQNLHKQLNLNEVSAIFGYSPKYMSVLFAKHADCSFAQFVNNKKIELAKKLLEDGDAKIYEISDNLGFESAFYFSKVFKKHTGLSPREFVRRMT